MEEKQNRFELDTAGHNQDVEWLVQRVAWILFTVLLLLIALGLFGRGGPISWTRISTANGALVMEYNRFIRYHSPDRLRFAARAAGTEIRVTIDETYINQIQIDRITPKPAHEISDAEGVTYVFNVEPGAVLTATFHFTPQTYGMLEGWVSADGLPALSFSQFAYP